MLFSLNLLTCISAGRHEAYYKSVTDQTFTLPGTETTISLLANEEVNVEVSYKVCSVLSIISYDIWALSFPFILTVLEPGCILPLHTVGVASYHAMDGSVESLLVVATRTTRVHVPAAKGSAGDEHSSHSVWDAYYRRLSCYVEGLGFHNTRDDPALDAIYETH